MASKARLPRSTYIPWPYLILIGGILLAFVLWATLSLPPRDAYLPIVKMGIGISMSLATLGGLGLVGQHRRALRELDPYRGSWRGYAPYGIAALLVLALVMALWPMPSGWNWLGTALTLLSVLAALLIGALLAAAGTPPKFREAQRAYETGQPGKALLLLNALEQERPEYYGTQYLYSLIYRDRGEANAARQACERLIALRPKLYFGHSELGLSLLDEGAPERARGPLRRAADLAPNLAQAHYNLGMATAQVGDHKATVDALCRALRLGLRDEVAEVIARYHLVHAFSALGHTSRAHTELQRMRRRQGVIERWRGELSEGRHRQGERRAEGRLISEIERLLDAPTPTH